MEVYLHSFLPSTWLCGRSAAVKELSVPFEWEAGWAPLLVWTLYSDMTNLSLLPGFNPHYRPPVTNHYTCWAIPAP